MNVSNSSVDGESTDQQAMILDETKENFGTSGGSDEKSSRRSARDAKKQGRGPSDFGGSDSPPTRGSSRHSSRLSSATQLTSYPREEKEAKKVVTVKPSMAPVTELGDSYPDWRVLEAELAAAKTLDNAYFLDASFLHALTLMDLWLGLEGPFFMPRREFRHRHCIFSLFWQPSAPNHAKSQYIVPKKLDGLLRWYLTRDNFIKYVVPLHPSAPVFCSAPALLAFHFWQRFLRWSSRSSFDQLLIWPRAAAPEWPPSARFW